MIYILNSNYHTFIYYNKNRACKKKNKLFIIIFYYFNSVSGKTDFWLRQTMWTVFTRGTRYRKELEPPEEEEGESE
jgi:hypothetical protein